MYYIYIFDSSFKILKLDLNDQNNAKWIKEYQHKYVTKCTRKATFRECYVIKNKIHIHFINHDFDNDSIVSVI